MANRERLLRVADAIEAEGPLRGMEFNMEYYINPRRYERSHCGTVACIAGHAMVLEALDEGLLKIGSRHVSVERAARALLNLRRPPDREDWEFGIFDLVSDWLDLTHSQASALFDPLGVDMDEVPATVAVETVRRFARTGRIYWPASVRI